MYLMMTDKITPSVNKTYWLNSWILVGWMHATYQNSINVLKDLYQKIR